jgi:hypothetical protein
VSPIDGCVFDALERIAQRRPEGALRDICGAIEGTLKKGGLGGREKYKAWVASNLDLILVVGFPGLKTASMRIAYSHPDLPPTIPPNTPSLEEIIYHVVRCELYHKGGLPSDIEFSDGIIAGGGLGRSMTIPADFVLGLILGVLISPENSAERMRNEPVLWCNGIPLHLNSFWGKKQSLLDALAYTRLAAPQPCIGPHRWQLQYERYD